ncbi:MAG TPA: hypothetical protein VGW78_07110 [Candidatus Babeliales bacterium]|jgi:hypothetical protein|nr:hypothetical protein [Candidatus Babeliales bacterium]
MKCLYHLALQGVLLLPYVNAQDSEAANQKYKQEKQQEAIRKAELRHLRREYGDRAVIAGFLGGGVGNTIQLIGEGEYFERPSLAEKFKNYFNWTGKNIANKNYPSNAWNPELMRFGQAIKWAGLAYMAYQPYAYWRQKQEIEKKLKKNLGGIEEEYKQEKVLSKPQEVPTMPQEVPAARPWYKFW